MARYYRELSRGLAAGQDPRLNIRNVNGPITVQGEDRSNVWIVAKASFHAESEDAADELVQAIADGISSDGETVRAFSPDHDGRGNGGGGVVDLLRKLVGHDPQLELTYEVSVPRNTVIELQLVNGTLDVRAVSGDVSARMVNGSFHVEDVVGDITLKHVNGHGEIVRVKGDVDLKTTNGNLRCDHSGGDLDVSMVNGRVEIVEAGGAINVRKVSGSLSLTGPVRGDVSLANLHGSIVLNLPEASRFELDARTSMGAVQSELDVRDSDGWAGSVPRVSLRSETGSIKLNKLRETEPAGV